MQRPSDFLQKTVEYIQASEFGNATASITGSEDENDASYDSVLGCLVKLFSKEVVPKEKIPEIVKQVATIYDQNADNPAQLNKKFDVLLSSFGIMSDNITEDQELVGLSSWTDMQLKEKISEFKRKQQDFLNTEGSLNSQIGQQLNKLLEEHGKRLGYKGKKIDAGDVNIDEDQEANKKPEGADSWFVVPSKIELEKGIKTHVICGSPMIKVFRDRYRIEHKLKKIVDVDLSKLESLSGDEAYKMKRELSRQKDFVTNYSDPTLVLDQDICAYEIASEFLTDKYSKPALIRIDDDLSYYTFKSGYLKDSFNSSSIYHVFSMEGNVIGRFAICLNRKEPKSGRFISDSYDIIEFQDGRPCLYFYSSKGVSSLSDKMVADIKLAIRNVNFDLRIPDPSVVGKTMTKEELEAFIKDHRGNKTVSESKDKKDISQGGKKMTENEDKSKLDTGEKEQAKEADTKDTGTEATETEEMDDVSKKNAEAEVAKSEKKQSTEEEPAEEELAEEEPAEEEPAEEEPAEEEPAEEEPAEEEPAEEEPAEEEPAEEEPAEEEPAEEEPAEEKPAGEEPVEEEPAEEKPSEEESIEEELAKEDLAEEKPKKEELEEPSKVSEPEAKPEAKPEAEPEEKAEEEDDLGESYADKVEEEADETNRESAEEKPEISEAKEESDVGKAADEASNVDVSSKEVDEEESDDVSEEDTTSENIATEEADEGGAKENKSEDTESDEEDKIKSRIDRLEEIAVNSFDALDKMEKKISKLDNFIETIQKNISSSKTSKNTKSKTSAKNEEKQVLKKRAAAIKEAIKKKKNKNTKEKNQVKENKKKKK